MNVYDALNNPFSGTQFGGQSTNPSDEEVIKEDPPFKFIKDPLETQKKSRPSLKERIKDFFVGNRVALIITGIALFILGVALVPVTGFVPGLLIAGLGATMAATNLVKYRQENNTHPK